MSNTLQILHSFPPKDRSAISSDAEYDRLIRDYVKAVQRIPSSALTGSEEGTGDLFAVSYFMLLLKPCLDLTDID